MEKQIELSLIIPAYKAGEFLNDSLKQKQRVLDSLHIIYEIIIIADGYDKSTEKLFHKLGRNRLRRVMLKKNKGKGYAVRKGFEMAKGRIISYMDADNDIDPIVIKQGYLALKNSDLQAILPSKNHIDSITNYPKDRKLFSIVYNFLVRSLFQLECSDTQLGAKIYSREFVENVLPHCKVNGFAFELEMLKVAQILGYNKYKEIPVKIDLKTKSTISFVSGLYVIRDTLILFPRMLILNAKIKRARNKSKNTN